MDKAKILEIVRDNYGDLKKLALGTYPGSGNPVEIIDGGEYNITDDVVTIVNAVLAAGQAASTAPRSPFEGGTIFMVGMDSLLRQAEAFDGGKVSTEAVRAFILSFQPRGIATTGPEKGGEPPKAAEHSFNPWGFCRNCDKHESNITAYSAPCRPQENSHG